MFVTESRSRLGILTLQHTGHRKEVGGFLDQRASIWGVRVLEHLTNPDDRGDYLLDDRAVGDVIGSFLWENTQRRTPAWRMGVWPITTIEESIRQGFVDRQVEESQNVRRKRRKGDGTTVPVNPGGETTGGNGTTVPVNPEGEKPPLFLHETIGNQAPQIWLPIIDDAYEADRRFVRREFDVPQAEVQLPINPGSVTTRFNQGSIDAWPRFPIPWTGIAMATNEEEKQKEIFAPVDPRLVVVNRRGGDADLGSRVTEVRTDHSPDGSRMGRLHQAFRVLEGPVSIDGSQEEPPQYEQKIDVGVLCWNVYRSGADDRLLGGLLYGRPSASIGGPADPNQGIVATLSSELGGPIDLGSRGDPHQIGTIGTNLVTRLNQGHISGRALYRFGVGGLLDAPLLHNGTATPQTGGEIPEKFEPIDLGGGGGSLPVFFVFDPSINHFDFLGRRRTGRHRWFALGPDEESVPDIYITTDRNDGGDDPPPDDPPPPPGGPPPTGPLTGPVPPGDGDMEQPEHCHEGATNDDDPPRRGRTGGTTRGPSSGGDSDDEGRRRGGRSTTHERGGQTGGGFPDDPRGGPPGGTVTDPGPWEPGFPHDPGPLIPEDPPDPRELTPQEKYDAAGVCTLTPDQLIRLKGKGVKLHPDDEAKIREVFGGVAFVATPSYAGSPAYDLKPVNESFLETTRARGLSQLFFRAQWLGERAPNYNQWTGHGPGGGTAPPPPNAIQMRRCNAPVIMRVESWGHQLDDKNVLNFDYTTSQAASRYSRVGTSSGGIAFLPPETSLDDVRRNEEPANQSRSSFLLADQVDLAIGGTPGLTDGAVHRGFVIRKEDGATDHELTFYRAHTTSGPRPNDGLLRLDDGNNLIFMGRQVNTIDVDDAVSVIGVTDSPLMEFLTPTPVDGTILFSFEGRLYAIDVNGVRHLLHGNQRGVSANTTIDETDDVINVDASGGAVTITLPPVADFEGRRFTVNKSDSSMNAVTIDGNGSETIDGQTSISTVTEHRAITMQSNGTVWWTV